MLVGYNTNISYKDKIYHIQTEDSGQSNPVIITLLYFQGAILASKKTSYEHLISEPNFSEIVKKIMIEQHKGMIKELLNGKYSGDSIKEKDEEVQLIQKESKNNESENQKKHSLDDILLNFIMKRTT